MLNVIPFKKEHVLDIKTRFAFSHEGKLSLAQNEGCPAYTVMEDDEVIAIGGVSLMWQGVGEAWMVVSEKGYSKPLSVAKYSLYLFNHIQEFHKFHRIQASVAVIDETANRFVNWLGFEIEGIMPKYGLDKSDYFRYARIAQ